MDEGENSDTVISVNAEFYAIGRITRSIGLKGELAIRPLTESPERFRKLRSVWIGKEGSKRKLFHAEETLIHRNTVRLKLEGINSPEESKQLVGSVLYVDEENLVETKKGSYFVHDIVGSIVVDEHGKALGYIAEIWKLPANDVYVTRDNGREYLIPATTSIIRKIDPKRKRVEIQTIEGLLD